MRKVVRGLLVAALALGLWAVPGAAAAYCGPSVVVTWDGPVPLPVGGSGGGGDCTNPCQEQPGDEHVCPM